MRHSRLIWCGWADEFRQIVPWQLALEFTEGLDDRSIRDTARADVHARAAQDLHPALRAHAHRLTDQAALPDARLTGEEECGRRPIARRVEGVRDRRQFGRAAYDDRADESTGHGADDRGGHGAHAASPIH